ncbi:MAG: FIST N-terminal domain-containing protein [Verrucomicrobiota bacterium JB023]|nr:FIST N-terminal domain-containing protein [Verrucomicrobiota bacterium JB023]
MRVVQTSLRAPLDDLPVFEKRGKGDCLALVFAPREWMSDPAFRKRIRESLPGGARVAGCSTSGEIHADGTHEESAVVTFIDFDSTEVELVVKDGSRAQGPDQFGEEMGEAILAKVPKPASVIVFSDGLGLNGTNLVHGLFTILAPHCPFSGGMAADGETFETTLVLVDDEVFAGSVLAVVLKGDRLKTSTASVSGWRPFGTFREVTDSEDNCLRSLDGETALKVYSSYLGPDAADLPASGAIYPLEVHPRDGSPPVIRGLLTLDREAESLTFAGDIPQGSIVRLMNASYDQLVDGAAEAARIAASHVPSAELALVVSCVGRKLALGSYSDLEVEAVKEMLPARTLLTGFHSYGEIGYDRKVSRIQHHNQTMTVTLFRED